MLDKFFVKLLGNGIIVIVMVMLLSNASFISALLTALALSILAYLFGDYFILPRTNNAIATVVDAFLVFILLWAIAANAEWTLSLSEILAITIVMGVFEWFLHTWMLRDGIRRDSSVRVRDAR
ncbi:DUF2512 family protein [Paenibacillus barengoltzii]|jgi:hypothetical protein|uniref:DUF2512 family protein n=1 Tax=Paenibacillus barengoltzii TaxID=343517 RepID=UPI000FDB0590|nr:DUF2512 family protein [Paenibacillus barengoltzii]MEC2344787.1 DUF2512 family protein [Paenibacillus barengoltzii]